MKLIFIRHGETQINPSGILHSANDSAGLTEKGRAQVDLAADILTNYNPDVIFVSPEKRAQETAEKLKQILKVQIAIVPELRERDWGDWSGRAWQDVRHMLQKMTLKARYAFIPPGGESWKQVETRAKEALQQILASGYVHPVIVTHGGMLRILMPVLTNSPIEKSFGYDFANGSLTVFEWSGRQFHEILINDISHLHEVLTKEMKNNDFKRTASKF